MDVLVAGTFLIVAVALFMQKPIKVEVTHKHIIEQQEVLIQDPNEVDKTAAEVEQSMNTVIRNLNSILNGGDDVEN